MYTYKSQTPKAGFIGIWLTQAFADRTKKACISLFCLHGNKQKRIDFMKLWNNFFGHLSTILHHKKLVRRLCFRAGLYKQGIMHDWSKYHPVEFLTGIKYYQGGKRSPNFGEKEAYGYSSAWLHHKGRNRHHFEYWIDYSLKPQEGLKGMPMPERYVIEMFCDRVAASKNYNRDSYDDSFPLAYYMKNQDHYVLHPDTRKLIEKLLNMLAEKGEEETFNYIRKEIDWKHSRKW